MIAAPVSGDTGPRRFDEDGIPVAVGTPGTLVWIGAAAPNEPGLPGHERHPDPMHGMAGRSSPRLPLSVPPGQRPAPRLA